MALLRRRPAAKARSESGYGVLEVETHSAPLPRALVRRPMLVRHLAGVRDVPLVLIAAPPGYGKSTLLQDWAAHDDRAFLWVSLAQARAADAAGVAEALRHVARGPEAQPYGCVLVLDDAQVVAPAILEGLLEAVLPDLPPGSAVALATRAEPELPVAGLRAHRALLELRMDDLAMGPVEAAVLMRRCGLELEPAALDTLLARTEGWPAALYLAALSLRHHDLPDDAVSGFAGNDHLLSDYLRDEVLSALPEDLETFALRTSLLDELSGPECDAALDCDSSALLLARLARTTQLLIPLDAAHTRYRWHRLFRDALRTELSRREPPFATAAHRRASRWYVRHGQSDVALAHAAAGEDAKPAAEILAANLAGYVTEGRIRIIERALGHFTPGVISGSRALALGAAYVSLFEGRLSEASSWASTAAPAPAPRRGGSELDEALVLLEAITSRSGAEALQAAAARARERTADASPWAAMSRFIDGVAAYLRGEHEQARRWLEDAVARGGGGQATVTSLSLAQLAMAAIEQREWDLAAELTDRAHAVLAEHDLGGEPLSAVVFAAAAASRARQGRSDEAKHDLQRGIDLLARLGDFLPWYGAETRILLAHASLWLADVVGARTLLAEASRLVRKVPQAVVFQRWFDDAWAYIDTLAETSLSGPSSLTIAELRVLRFLPSHRSFREIAAQLGVSTNTVKTQAHAIYRKLDVASRSEAVARASQAGLLGQ